MNTANNVHSQQQLNAFTPITKPDRMLIIIALLTSLLCAFWTIDKKPLSNHECYVSITAREMLANNEYIIPTCNAKLRLEKTPLSYWLVAFTGQIAGQINEFVTRLPSALSAFLSAAAIIYFGSRLFNHRTAAISAMVWACSLGYVRYAHNARPEMLTASLITISLLSFFTGFIETNRKRQIIYMLIFWTFLGMANVAKAPIPIPLIGLPIAAYIIISKQFKKISKCLPIIGPLIFLLIAMPWPIAIFIKMSGNIEIWKEQWLDRFFGEPTSDAEPWYYYLPRTFQFIAPWVVFLPFALAAPFFKIWQNKRPAMWFLWYWLVTGIFFLSLAAGKRQHYLLPMLPAAAILIGIVLEDMIFTQKAYKQKLIKDNARNHLIAALIISSLMILAAIPAVYSFLRTNLPESLTTDMAKYDPQIMPWIAVTALVIIAGTVITTVLFKKQKKYPATAAIFITLTITIMIALTHFIYPLHYNRHSRDFSIRLSQIVPENEPLYAFESVSNRTINYVGRVIPEIGKIPKTTELYKKGAWILATANHLKKLQENADLRMVYKKQKAERLKRDDVPGALYHISAQKLKTEP